MYSRELQEFRDSAHEFLLAQSTALPTPQVARHLFGARRHEMPETQVVVRALLSGDGRFVRTHDNRWTVAGGKALARVLADTSFAVVDLETTGSVIGVDEIIEIGVVVVQGGRIARRYETLVWTDRPIPPWVARLTGINNADLDGAPTISDVAEEVIALLDGAMFVAHDIRFDLPFLSWEFARRGLARPAVTGLCTLQLSRDLWPDLESRSLPDLARMFGLQHDNPHRAADDAAATAGVLLAALDTAAERGLTEIADLYRVAARATAELDDAMPARAAES